MNEARLHREKGVAIRESKSLFYERSPFAVGQEANHINGQTVLRL